MTARLMSVSMPPGAIALTVTPCWPTSWASARVKASPAPALLDRLHHVGGRPGAGVVIDGDVGALVGEGLHDGPAEATAAAGDERHAPGETPRAGGTHGERREPGVNRRWPERGARGFIAGPGSARRSRSGARSTRRPCRGCARSAATPCACATDGRPLADGPSG